LDLGRRKQPNADSKMKCTTRVVFQWGGSSR